MDKSRQKGKLKIATWNCNGAYRKKQKHLLNKFKPDIWVIQECEHPDKFSKAKNFNYPSNSVWYGDNPNRGVGVFSKSGYELEISENHTPNFKYILPVSVSGIKDLTIYAVWVMKEDKEKRKQRYIGQLFGAFNYYQLCGSDALIIGDYNWNLNFDRSSYGLHGKFSDFLNQMKRQVFKVHTTIIFLKNLERSLNQPCTCREKRETISY